MKAWVERSSEATPATHALVLGVSHYQYLDDEESAEPRETFGLHEAKTPATSAWAFANWLKDSYNNPKAPLVSIRLLLSPSDWERQHVGGLAGLPVEVLPATRDNVEVAVGEWHDLAATNRDNVAILYAAGHGIQMSKDDGGIVLLEDFARLKNSPLAHSLNVPGVRDGMAGPTIAQQQFYFVDACRVRPEAAIAFKSLGEGVSLSNPVEGAPLCSAVFFSASPSTEALGLPGAGTLFVQALLDCLRLVAVDDHVHENNSWVVTTSTLMRALPKRVTELAASFGERQTATVGGQLAEVVLHVLPGRPEVPVTLELHPGEASGCARARLWDGLGTGSVFVDRQFTPTLSHTVPAGMYVLTVTISPPTPPYREVPAQPIAALPPAVVERVAVYG